MQYIRDQQLSLVLTSQRAVIDYSTSALNCNKALKATMTFVPSTIQKKKKKKF